jgi:hypothetical protein
MPELHAALAAARWGQDASWDRAARHIGDQLRPFALLAHEFCPWSDILRRLFHDLVRMPPTAPGPLLPKKLSRMIPRGLIRWEPLRHALRRWRPREGDRVLAELHRQVFRERGYERDLWICWEDGRRLTYPGRASWNIAQARSDCRWRNAVWLMGPGS